MKRYDLTHDARPGQHVCMAIEDALELAMRTGKRVRFQFNGVRLILNKRLSADHVYGQWSHSMEAKGLKYRQSAGYRKQQEELKVQQEEYDFRIRSLLQLYPRTKIEIAQWIGRYVPASDLKGVNRQSHRVVAMLTAIGFSSDQHVGENALNDGTAGFQMRLEYLAGQVIAMLESAGMVHPIIGMMASELATDMKEAGDLS